MSMTFADFYLICFVVGFALSLLSFVFSGLHWHLPVKWHFHGAGTHQVTTFGAKGAAGMPHAGNATGSSSARGIASWLNPPVLFAFLAWFGGTGYLLTQYYRVWFLLGLAAAIFAGVIGAAIVSWFLVKVLLPHETILQDSDYELVGTVAKVNSPIREGGTGEIVFSQAGVRRCAGARREDGQALEKGREVVIARVEKGIAYVAPWEEWSK
jgi:membrane protein implicated in regulation of membrane protease activity